MEKPILNDPNTPPTADVLEQTLDESYPVFRELMKTITGPEYGLVADWNYYKDGKTWLCKVSYKKKTVFWLSVWDHFFKTGFYFTEKTGPGISTLDIDEKIKENFSHSKNVGKLIPLAISVTQKAQIKDIITIIGYKKELK
jgi:hypothetical protein